MSKNYDLSGLLNAHDSLPILLTICPALAGPGTSASETAVNRVPAMVARAVRQPRTSHPCRRPTTTPTATVRSMTTATRRAAATAGPVPGRRPASWSMSRSSRAASAWLPNKSRIFVSGYSPSPAASFPAARRAPDPRLAGDAGRLAGAGIGLSPRGRVTQATVSQLAGSLAGDSVRLRPCASFAAVAATVRHAHVDSVFPEPPGARPAARPVQIKMNCLENKCHACAWRSCQRHHRQQQVRRISNLRISIRADYNDSADSLTILPLVTRIRRGEDVALIPMTVTAGIVVATGQS